MKNKIEKISDLEIGETYYVCLVKNIKLVRTAKLLGLVNETVKFKSDKTEIYLDLYRDKNNPTRNLLYVFEIGIGNTKLEAFNNYNKFKYEKLKNETNDFEKLKNDLKIKDHLK
jgi:hypothetical protein